MDRYVESCAFGCWLGGNPRPGLGSGRAASVWGLQGESLLRLGELGGAIWWSCWVPSFLASRSGAPLSVAAGLRSAERGRLGFYLLLWALFVHCEWEVVDCVLLGGTWVIPDDTVMDLRMYGDLML